MNDLRRSWWMPTLILLIIGLDQWTKHWAAAHLANHRVVPIIAGLFDFSLTHNTGAAFGLGRAWDPRLRAAVFLGLSTLAVCGMAFYLFRNRRESLWISLPLTLIVGGAIGNLLDRYRLGYVIDFIHVFYKQWHWPNFNIADSAISVGMVLFAIHLLFGERLKRP